MMEKLTLKKIRGVYMTLSEKMAFDMISDMDFEQDKITDVFGAIGFALTVARDNNNWEIVNDLLEKGYGYLISK